MKRTLRPLGNCLGVTIPKKVLELYKWKKGDKIEIEILSATKLSLKKA